MILKLENAEVVVNQERKVEDIWTRKES